MQFSFISSDGYRTDWLCISKPESYRVTMARDGILRHCGEPVDEITRQAFNIWQREKWRKAAQEMRGNPDKWPSDIAESVLARGPRLATASP